MLVNSTTLHVLSSSQVFFPLTLACFGYSYPWGYLILVIQLTSLRYIMKNNTWSVAMSNLKLWHFLKQRHQKSRLLNALLLLLLMQHNLLINTLNGGKSMYLPSLRVPSLGWLFSGSNFFCFWSCSVLSPFLSTIYGLLNLHHAFINISETKFCEHLL